MAELASMTAQSYIQVKAPIRSLRINVLVAYIQGDQAKEEKEVRS